MLSKEQQNIIENSIWVVNTALKRQGLQADEDLRQSAMLYMCKCLQHFDENQNVKWTTYAYKSVFLFIKRTHGKEMRKKSMLVSEDMLKSIEPLPSAQDEPFEKGEYLLENIKAFCSPEERQVLEFKRQGYTNIEISAFMKCSPSKVNGCMQSIKGKAKEMEL